jgi:MFS family permease
MINRNFTLLWIGKIISQLGDKFYGIALAWWILQKTNSAPVMGAFMFVSLFPSIVLGLYAGAFADRWKRRTILIVTDLVRGFLVLAVSCLALSRTLQVWHIFVISFLLSVTTAFFEPAVQALVPELVDKKELPRANGANQAVGGFCTVAGPAFGAMAVSVFGMGHVFMANSISYFASALLSCFILVGQEYRDFREKTRMWDDIKEGVRFLKGRESILRIYKIIAAAHFFLGSLTVSLPFLAKSLNGSGVRNLGLLESMMGVGLISGSVFIGARKKGTTAEQRLIPYMLVVGICFGVLSILLISGSMPVYGYLAVMAVIGCCIAFASVTWQSLLQNFSPSHMTGRVFSISSLIGNVTLPVAYFLFGLLLSLTPIWVVMAGCGAALAVLCYCFRMPRLAAEI